MCPKDDSFDFQVLNLTKKFYADYPNPPYNCLLLQSHYDYFICIPYRSHISHKYAYKFKKSIRSKKTHSGLDYSKIVLICNSEYIGSTNAIVDKDKFNETRDNIEYIRNDAQNYINNYINFVLGNASKR